MIERSYMYVFTECIDFLPSREFLMIHSRNLSESIIFLPSEHYTTNPAQLTVAIIN